MPQLTLSGIVKRRFIHCVNRHKFSARILVKQIGVSPGDLCRIIAGRDLNHLPLIVYVRIARWLQMPLANVMVLANLSPDIADLVRLDRKSVV